MRADHDIGIAGIGPFRQPAAFLIGLEQGLYPFAALPRLQEDHQRMQGTESVPGREVGMGRAHVDAVVERTVVAAAFPQLTRQLPGVVEGGVEDAFLLIRDAVHGQQAQFGVPDLAGGAGEAVDAEALELFQVGARLLRRNEGSAKLDADAPCTGRESHPCAGAGPCPLSLAFDLKLPVEAAADREGTVEAEDEPALEVGQFRPPAVAHAVRVVADDLASVGIDAYPSLHAAIEAGLDVVEPAVDSRVELDALDDDAG